MKKKLVFRFLKTNRYSIVSLVAAIIGKNINTEIYEIKEIDAIKTFPPKDTVVCYSFMSPDFKYVKEEVMTLKKMGYTTIAGGPHVSARYNKLYDLFDHLFIGDGEENIIKFLKGDNSKLFDGISNRIDLDNYPPFCIEKNLFMPIEITRGCPFSCKYCQTPNLMGKIPRHRSIENILYYSKLAIKKGKKISRFISPNSFAYLSKNYITPNLKSIYELLNGLKKIGMKEIYFGTFPSEVRPESINADILEIIKEFVNNKHIVIGVQSASERILKKINRNHNLDHVMKVIALVREKGFIPVVDIIIGFPFEIEEDVIKTYNFVKKIYLEFGARVHLHTFMPLPGTEFEDLPPGKLTKLHKRKFGELVQKGIINGYWIKQEKIAKELKNI